ncbi:enolase C-terminal domain-like protein [Schleiferilactobacillus perolens]|jgi:mannonate dehydratase|uniref:L-Ala-D L-Glu epimerase n=1 Tax=Schleiferilactobacillus perolens DSM 12744 TaxID=1423792 RepID=A0A0R1N2Z6_9LACO|nr:enolase C-terminal domain-like protein [Schleiferilactobacillus perolens]KRL14513.1 L-Ala-D L-Glu epimerase [Schleiferilactobacillus perolens DSM 12744]MCI2170132.1 starvation-sensing protein RspA [Schleiferilactobacillus perolens]
MNQFTITNVSTLVTAPEGINLLVVKVTTNDPAIFGWGCATFTQRYKAVETVVNDYLKPFLIGKDPQRIEDLWQTMTNSSYWRNGPVLNNAISGVDMALWDIKGKIAGLPLYELFGGKCRDAVPAYIHVGAPTIEDAVTMVRDKVQQGWRNIRVQIGGYGGKAQNLHCPSHKSAGHYYDPQEYMDTTVALFARLREEFGNEISFSHDVHERLAPADALNFAKRLEPYNLFFLEDALPPEQIDWLARLRQQTSIPLAIGELFNNPHEWMDVLTNRYTDYLRLHISQAGGITPVRKIIAMAEMFGIRTAWHGPGDLSGIGHAVSAQLSISSPNCGVQEWSNSIGENTYTVFPGTPMIRKGYLYVNDQPGIGVTVDEAAAEEFPPVAVTDDWTLARLPDGTAARP